MADNKVHYRRRLHLLPTRVLRIQSSARSDDFFPTLAHVHAKHPVHREEAGCREAARRRNTWQGFKWREDSICYFIFFPLVGFFENLRGVMHVLSRHPALLWLVFVYNFLGGHFNTSNFDWCLTRPLKKWSNRLQVCSKWCFLIIIFFLQWFFTV